MYINKGQARSERNREVFSFYFAKDYKYEMSRSEAIKLAAKVLYYRKLATSYKAAAYILSRDYDIEISHHAIQKAYKDIYTKKEIELEEGNEIYGEDIY